jgi:hypothetical protein
MKRTTKAFKETPQPPMPTLSAAALNYVEKGPGKDRVSQKDQEMRLAFLLPVRLHTRFKPFVRPGGLRWRMKSGFSWSEE